MLNRLMNNKKKSDSNLRNMLLGDKSLGYGDWLDDNDMKFWGQKLSARLGKYGLANRKKVGGR